MQDKVSKEDMFTLIRQWQQSGLNQKQYCHDHNIPYHVFHYWYKRFRDEQQPNTTGSFVQLRPTMISNVPFAEFTFPGGSRILFHQPVSIEYLKALAG